MEDQYSDYSTKIFLDTNVILEGRPFSDMPWVELECSGPILILLTPRVLKEIDAKKRDGRLAQRARDFNRLIAPAIGSAAPISLIREPIKIDIAIAHCAPIPWEQYDDLDKSEPDAHVIAEVLHVLNVPADQRLFLSQDINPLAMARRHAIRFFHISDKWMRAPDPHPFERENAKLKQQLAELRKTEPDLEISFQIADDPHSILRVHALSDAGIANMIWELLRRNPKPKQNKRQRDLNQCDETLDTRYSSYANVAVPTFAQDIHKKLELHFNLLPISFTIINRGLVRAESILMDVNFSGGWINRWPIYVAPSPTPPVALDSLEHPIQSSEYVEYTLAAMGRYPDGPGPRRSKQFPIELGELRHNYEWTWNGFVWLDPHSDRPPTISVGATAANLHGTVKAFHTLTTSVSQATVEELIEIGTRNYRRSAPIDSYVEAAQQSPYGPGDLDYESRWDWPDRYEDYLQRYGG